MAQAASKQAEKKQRERRRVERTALRLSAMMRDGTKSRVKVRVIDMSTHGCRIECTSTVDDDSWVWLSIAGLENQFSRVVWHCQEFIGLQFEKPLSDAVFERLLQEQGQLPETTINELRSIANRTIGSPARPANRTSRFWRICRADAPLMPWSRGCAAQRPRREARAAESA